MEIQYACIHLNVKQHVTVKSGTLSSDYIEPLPAGYLHVNIIL